MMRAPLFHMISAALLCLPMMATVDAQSSSAPQVAKPEQPVTTIVGCLVQGIPNATGTERRPQTGADANDYFVRTPTVAVPVGTTVTVGKPGTTDTTTSSGTPRSDSFYRISGLQREQLQPHVGHRVELQGHLSSTSAREATSATTTVDQAGRAVTKVETRVDVAGVLHATAIKMLSTTCP